MGKEKATIYDYARICESFEKCNKCILLKFCSEQRNIFSNDVDKANEIILKWIEEHPVKTRQDKFLEMFPNACMYKGAINICPCSIDCDYNCKNKEKFVDFDCSGCKKEYWLAEVQE